MTKPVVSPVYAAKIDLALQSARACALREQDHSVRDFLLTEIAGIQVRVGDWEGAYREVMSSEEIRKDAYLKTDILAEMARAQASLGNVSGALGTIRDALVLGDYVFPLFSRLCQIVREQGEIADETTLNVALDLAERTSTEQLAKERAKGRIGTLALTWLTSLAEAQARGGRREKAAQTLQSALDMVSSDEFDHYLRRQEVLDCGYAEIVGVQARIGDIPGALINLEMMSDRGRIESGMPMIAAALADGGDLSGALAFVARMDEAEPKAKALRFIAGSQAQHGDSVGARKTLAHVEPFTDRREQTEEGLYYVTLAEVQCDGDSAPRALAKIVQDVDEAQLNPWLTTTVYAAVGEAYAAVGLVAEALRMFERIPSDRDRFERATFASRDSLVRMITKAHTVAGNVEVAEAWVLTVPSPSEQCSAWLGIVDGLVSRTDV